VPTWCPLGPAADERRSALVGGRPRLADAAAAAGPGERLLLRTAGGGTVHLRLGVTLRDWARQGVVTGSGAVGHAAGA